VTPFDSIERLAQKRYRIFPVSLLLTDKFDSASRVPRIGAKTLVFLAEHDEVIPRESSEALIAKFPAGQVTVAIIKGTGHNTIGQSPEYVERLRRFL
jgi:pimeloyl-ACP methyl ester carboxylesterase